MISTTRRSTAWMTAIGACSASGASCSSLVMPLSDRATRRRVGRDLVSLWGDGIERRAEGFKLVEYDIPAGCIGGYYPETNSLVPLDSYADQARTPTSKSIPVLLERSRATA